MCWIRLVAKAVRCGCTCCWLPRTSTPVPRSCWRTSATVWLRQNTSASASAAGVPQAVNLPKEVGIGYLRLGLADDLTRFRAESLWRDYRKPGNITDDLTASTV